jgi:steroid 5-alpha reductase family enzyme
VIEKLFSDPNAQHLASVFLLVMLVFALLSFVVSELTRNYSQVDKLWSLMPIIYSAIAASHEPSPRVIIMLLMTIVWGIRLSYNFSRKGGYNIIPWRGEEDFRWKIMSEVPALKGRIRFGIFNLVFISFYQHFLILLFCTPVLIAVEKGATPLNFIDIIAVVLMAASIFLETVADNQLYRFHLIKKQVNHEEGKYSQSLKSGFLREGLWKKIRHPNYLGEQGAWISFYIFSIAASGEIIKWSIAGSVLLVLLFVGSSSLTEKISSNKYTDYIKYMETAGRYFPKFFRNCL